MELFEDSKGKIKRIVIMPSIRHCGNRVIRDDIFKCGKLFTAANVFKPICVENIFMFSHLPHKSYIDTIDSVIKEADEKCYLISPLRHPVLVKESYKRRGIDIEIFEDHWSTFMEFSKDYNIKYIHVDNKKLRNKEVLEMENDLGIELGKTWGTKYCNKGTHNHVITEEDLSTMPNTFIDFYENTKTI